MLTWVKAIFEQPPAELWSLHNHVQSRFTYVTQDGEWKNGRVYLKHDLNKPFSGDCDDWASTMVANLPGAEYVEFYLPNGVYHAACLYKGWISDCLRRMPYKAGSIKFNLRLPGAGMKFTAAK